MSSELNKNYLDVSANHFSNNAPNAILGTNTSFKTFMHSGEWFGEHFGQESERVGETHIKGVTENGRKPQIPIADASNYASNWQNRHPAPMSSSSPVPDKISHKGNRSNS